MKGRRRGEGSGASPSVGIYTSSEVVVCVCVWGGFCTSSVVVVVAVEGGFRSIAKRWYLPEQLCKSLQALPRQARVPEHRQALVFTRAAVQVSSGSPSPSEGSGASPSVPEQRYKRLSYESLFRLSYESLVFGPEQLYKSFQALVQVFSRSRKSA